MIRIEEWWCEAHGSRHRRLWFGSRFVRIADRSIYRPTQARALNQW